MYLLRWLWCFCCIISLRSIYLFSLFFFNDTATTVTYTLSLHDALPIYLPLPRPYRDYIEWLRKFDYASAKTRSEEHTSELQSRLHLVCRLLLEKKKNTKTESILPCSRSHKGNSTRRIPNPSHPPNTLLE